MQTRSSFQRDYARTGAESELMAQVQWRPVPAKRFQVLPRLLWPGVVVVALWCCSCATVTIPPELKSRVEADRRVVVVAPKVDLMRYMADGHSERQHQEATQMAWELTSLAAAEMAKRGFEVKPAALDKAQSAQIGSMYERLDYLYNIPPMPAKFDYAFVKQMTCLCVEDKAPPKPKTIGFIAEALPVIAQDKVDALLFIRLVKFSRSAGSIAKEFAIDFAANMIVMPLTAFMIQVQPAPPSGGVLVAAFVDARTGDVLWEGFSASTYPSWMISNAFVKFDFGAQSPNVTAKVADEKS